ncbi:MAG: type II toxin-antitoxin system RelE/ParE family toxin [Dehalococcoidia bacterium]
MRLRWTPDARRSLAAIRSDWNQLSRGAGTRAGKRIVASTRHLRRFPESGRVVPEYGVETVREIIEDPFRVWYVIESRYVTVIAVFHAARDTR